jgi:hypothetical protein
MEYSELNIFLNNLEVTQQNQQNINNLHKQNNESLENYKMQNNESLENYKMQNNESIENYKMQNNESLENYKMQNNESNNSLNDSDFFLERKNTKKENSKQFNNEFDYELQQSFRKRELRENPRITYENLNINRSMTIKRKPKIQTLEIDNGNIITSAQAIKKNEDFENQSNISPFDLNKVISIDNQQDKRNFANSVIDYSTFSENFKSYNDAKNNITTDNFNELNDKLSSREYLPSVPMSNQKLF